MKKLLIGFIIACATATSQAAEVLGFNLGGADKEAVAAQLQQRGDKFQANTDKQATELPKIWITQSQSLSKLGEGARALLEFAPSGPLYHVMVAVKSNPSDLDTLERALTKKYGEAEAIQGEERKVEVITTFYDSDDVLVMFRRPPVGSQEDASLSYTFRPLLAEVKLFEDAQKRESAKTDFDKLVDQL